MNLISSLRIVIVFIYILVFLCFIYFVAACFLFIPCSLMPIVKKDINLDDFKTGDLVGTRSRFFFIKLFDRSDFSHPGIIYVDPETNEKFVLEGARYKNKKYEHFFKIPLELWLYITKKCDNVHVSINKAADPKKIYKAFEPFIKEAKLDWANVNWSRFLKRRSFDKPKYKKRYACIEAVISTLQHAEVYRKKYDCSSYLPSEIIYGGIPCEDGYYYSPPVQLDCKKWLTHIEITDGKFINTSKKKKTIR